MPPGRVILYLPPGGSKFTSVLLIMIFGFNQCMCLPKAELNTKNETEQPLLSCRLVSFFFCSTGFSLSIKVSPLEYDVFSEWALSCPGYFLYKTIATSHTVEDSTYVTGYQFAIYHNILFRLTLSYKIDWDS